MLGVTNRHQAQNRKENMITASESKLGSTMSKVFVVTIILSFGIQAFLIPADQVGYNETWGPALSILNFVLSFAFLFVLYIGTKLFGGDENAYVNVTGTMAFVAHVVNTMPAFGAIGQENSIGETFLTTNQVIDATSAATSCLLYTSPSPRDRSLSRMPSSA